MRQLLISMLLTLWLLTPVASCFLVASTEQKWLTVTQRHPMAVVAVTKKFGERDVMDLMEQFMTHIEKSDLVADYGLKVVMADGSQTSHLSSYCEGPSQTAFLLMVKGQMSRMSNFAELFEQLQANRDQQTALKLARKTEGFIQRRLDDINKPIFSQAQLDELIDKQKLVFVYFGDELSPNSLFVNEFATRHFDFDFYFIGNKTLTTQLLGVNGSQARSPDTTFGVFRHPSLVDDFDSQSMTLIDFKGNPGKLEVFFRYEQYPKLVNGTTGSDVFQRVLQTGAKLVIYLWDRQSPQTDMLMFTQQVRALPKQFIFAQADAFSLDSTEILRIFSETHLRPFPNCVYLLGFEGDKIEGHVLVQSPFRPDSLVSSLKQYYGRNPQFFNPDERDIPLEAFEPNESVLVEDL